MNNADISNIEILYCNAKLSIDFIYFLCTKHKKTGLFYRQLAETQNLSFKFNNDCYDISSFPCTRYFFPKPF